MTTIRTTSVDVLAAVARTAAIRTSAIDVLAAVTRTAAIRTTAIDVLVAYTKPISVDLSNLYIDYIYKPSAGNVYEESASNSLTLVSEASAYLVKPATDILSITQDASIEQLRPTQNGLNVTDEATYVLVPLQITEDLLVIIDEATCVLFALQSVESALEITDEATYFNNIRIGSLIQLQQSASVNLVVNRDLTSELTISSNITLAKTIQLPVSSSFSLSTTTSFKHAIFRTADASVLSITQSADTFRNIFNVLTITQTASGYIYYLPGTASNSLSITQSIELQKYIAVNALSTFALSQDAFKESIWNRSASSELEFAQSIGNAKFGGKIYLILQAPYGYVLDTIILPKPQLQNKYALPLTTIVKKSINNTMRTVIKTNDSTILRFVFVLNNSTAEYLQYFIREYNADYMLLQDWLGRKWKVKLLTNPVIFTNNTPFASDVSLEFEGVQINA